jgi:hypothetical protein
MTHQVLDRHGNILSSIEQPNLIVNTGISELNATAGPYTDIGDLTAYAVLGWEQRADVAATDDFFRWQGFVACCHAVVQPTFQCREVVALSSKTLGGPQANSWIDPDPGVVRPYYHNQIARGFKLDPVATSEEQFLSILYPDMERQCPLSPDDCGPVAADKSVIQKWGMVRHSGRIVGALECFDIVQHPNIWTVTDLFSTGVFRDVMGDPLTYAFGQATQPNTILLPDDGELRLLYDLRMYPPEELLFEGVDMGGTPTDIRIRGINGANSGAWSNAGAMTRFGRWDSLEAKLSGTAFESNVLPPMADANIGIAATLQTGPVLIDPPTVGPIPSRRYRFQARPSEANGFGTGVGAIEFCSWANTGNTWCLAATFDPKLPKTDLDAIYLDIEFTWGNHVP